MKFLHLSPHIHDVLFQDNIMISGFYCINLAFNSYPNWTGEFGYLRTYYGKLKNYDLIYVCCAKPELEGRIIDQIRNEIGYGKDAPVLVGSVDYACELWDMPFNPLQLRDQLEKCDIIVASEPALRSTLHALMNDRTIYLLPHPTNIDSIKQFRKPINARQFNIAALIHRYDNNWKTIFMVLYRMIELKQKGREMPDLEAILLSGDETAKIELMPFFGKIQMGMPYPQQMEYLGRQLICVDSYHRLHTYGRTVVDCAAIGLPLVGTKLQYLQNFLFPRLTTDPYDLYAQQDLVQRLVEDKTFYQEVVDYAYSKVDEYGFTKSVERFLAVVEKELPGRLHG